MWAFTLLMTGKKHADWLTHCPTRWWKGGGGGKQHRHCKCPQRTPCKQAAAAMCERITPRSPSTHSSNISHAHFRLILPYIVWKEKKNKNSGSNLEKKNPKCFMDCCALWWGTAWKTPRIQVFPLVYVQTPIKEARLTFANKFFRFF